MPRLDGIGLIRELRQEMSTSHIPIILLTAKSTTESKIAGLEEGADDYITKPFSAAYLQARVENCCNNDDNCASSTVQVSVYRNMKRHQLPYPWLMA